MAVFTYQASASRTSGSQIQEGSITADSPRQARDQLRQSGLVVRALVEQRAPRTSALWQTFLAKRQQSHITAALQEMSTLLGAGIPLLEALETCARQRHGRVQQAILLLHDQVASGGTLAGAMGQQPAAFDRLCVGIVHVGENAGTLDVALERIVAFRRRSARLTNQVTAALIYPAIVLSVGVTVSLFLMTFVVPNLLQVLVESGRPLPTATVIVKGASDLLLTGWWWLALVGIGVCVAAAMVLKSERGQAAWHRGQLRIPVFGELVRQQAIARLALVMATLLKSDVSFVTAAEIAGHSIANRVLRSALAAGAEAVCSGRDIAPALQATGAFPPVVIQIFAVGQASGQLEKLLEDLAADYDAQVELTASRLTALIEPVLMILLALVVGLIAFATILPILEAGDVL